MNKFRVFIIVVLAVMNIPGYSVYNLPSASQGSVRKCTHVDSEEDELCGGLWRAIRYTGMPSYVSLSQKKIHIIVAHCQKPLHELQEYIKGFKKSTLGSIHIISKCGQEVKGAPEGAVVQVLPNVGRCDHTYAYFITRILPEIVEGKHRESIAVFFKDDISAANWFHTPRRSFETLASLASSSNGFACYGEKYQRKLPGASAYHDKKTLLNFSMREYNVRQKEYRNLGDEVLFKSEYANLGEYFNWLNITLSQDVVPVCYGGIFAASVENIYKVNMQVWEKIEESLMRGDNIEEGHFAERSWAALLSNPLEDFQVEALKKHSSKVIQSPYSFRGILSV